MKTTSADTPTNDPAMPTRETPSSVPTLTRPTDPALVPVDAPTAIDVPTARAPYPVGDGIHVLPAYLPAPGMGILPANAFLIDGPEPILVDAGPGGAEAGFQAALTSLIDPAAIRWIWLTHTDPDHVGSLQWLLDVAPEARLITTYLAVGKLGMTMEVPMQRLMWVNPGTTVEVGGRSLHAVRPPSFDAPETTALFDQRSRTFFSADSFGALLQAPAASAADLDPGEMAEGMALWTTVDSPWLTHTDRATFDRTIAALRAFDARRVLSAHLPPAAWMTDRLLDTLATVPGSAPWVGPDQAALDQLLAALGG